MCGCGSGGGSERRRRCLFSSGVRMPSATILVVMLGSPVLWTSAGTARWAKAEGCRSTCSDRLSELRVAALTAAKSAY